MTTTAAHVAPPKSRASSRRHPSTFPGRLEYNAKQAAALVGMTTRTLRYYQQIGLIPEPARRGGSLIYTEEHLLPLLQIKRLTTMGLSLDDVAEVLVAPSDTRSIQLLKDLDRALADQAIEVQSQRRIISELLRTQTPVDVLPEFARYVAALRRLGNRTSDTATTVLVNMVAGFKDADTASLEALIGQLADFPGATDLTVLEERLHAIGPEASEGEVTSLALDYGRILIRIYDDFAASRQGDSAWTTDGAIDQVSATLMNHTTNDRQRDVLSRAITILADHFARLAAKD